MSVPASKSCQTCGREIEWRKKWGKDWENVRYCSQKCRRDKPGEAGADLEKAILALLEMRKRGATICPSEVARQVGTEDGWRELMEPVRQAARRLVARDRLEITQKGKVVDPSRAKGAIRLRRKG